MDNTCILDEWSFISREESFDDATQERYVCRVDVLKHTVSPLKRKNLTSFIRLFGTITYPVDRRR